MNPKLKKHIEEVEKLRMDLINSKSVQDIKNLAPKITSYFIGTNIEKLLDGDVVNYTSLADLKMAMNLTITMGLISLSNMGLDELDSFLKSQNITQ